MSYDTKAQKNGPELEKGAALSTVFFVEEEEEKREDAQPPSKSTANVAD